MSEVALKPRARMDLQEIWLQFEQYSERSAERTIGEFNEIFEKLAMFPKMGRERPDLNQSGLRSFPIRDYIIFYVEVDRGVEVVRVLHGAADISDII
jgi:toxin ParE1/3/4